MLLLFVIVSTVIISDAAVLDQKFGELRKKYELISRGGRTKRFVQYSVNKPNIPYEACTLPDGAAGHCRHLHYCVQDDFKDDMMRMAEYLCIIEGSSVGVCCPDDYERSLFRTLAGDLPATANKEEDSQILTRMVKIENRGCGISGRPHSGPRAARTDEREWPWIAFVIPSGFLQHCGGALITDRHVITAAHCTKRWEAEELRVRLGEYDFERNNETRDLTFGVVEKREHERFEKATFRHDIAILKLNRSAVFNNYIWPICLPAPGLDLTNRTAVVIGWGKTYYKGNISNVLREVSVPVWENKRCRDLLIDPVFEENICAAGYEGGRDSCKGDSGGPLMYQMGSGRWALVGVVSWGVRCGEAAHPGVYTRVDRYLPWISKNLH